MKDLVFYDERHGNVCIVKNPKSRKEAWKTLVNRLVGKWFENEEGVERHVTEVEKVIEID